MIIYYYQYSLLQLSIFQCEDRKSKLAEIKDIITQAVTERCSCRITSEDIIDDTFNCFGPQGKYTNSVVYKATLRFQNSDIIASHVVTDISQWVQSNRSVVVNKVMLDIDPRCLTMRNPFDSIDCYTNDTVVIQKSISNNEEQDPNRLSTAILVVIIAGSVILLLILMLIGMVFWKYRQTIVIQPKRSVFIHCLHIILSAYIMRPTLTKLFLEPINVYIY